MGYPDAQGRPELVVHPDIKRGTASYRHLGTVDDDAALPAPARAVKRESSPIRRRAEEALRAQRSGAPAVDNTHH